MQFWDYFDAGSGSYINYWLLPKATVDARGNTAGVIAYDMRLLQPLVMHDINSNISEILYDALGMPVAMAIKGKVGTDPGAPNFGLSTEGDTLAGLDLYSEEDLDNQVAFFLDSPEDAADALLVVRAGDPD